MYFAATCVFLVSYSNAGAGAGYTFYPLSLEDFPGHADNHFSVLRIYLEKKFPAWDQLNDIYSQRSPYQQYVESYSLTVSILF